MKHFFGVSLLFLIVITASRCGMDSTSSKTGNRIISLAETQYEQLYDSVREEAKGPHIFPRTVKDDKLVLVSPYDWTSGFFPGSLWYLYALTKNDKWKSRATNYTELLDTIQYWKGNHDVGFMIECSYGNALKNLKSKEYEKVIVQTAKSLSSRFRPKAGIIQSWNSNKKWKCPVIIDNMMNLELLFHATRISGDSTYYRIAVSHADKTMQNHFRPDNSSYHVLDYDIETGEVLAKNTHQGYADESAWARGQAWGLYGFTVCYRETKNPAYLQQAIKIADFIMTNPQLPKDKVPYWDYDVPKEKTTPRDASAAAIAASALYELSTFVTPEDQHKYVDWSDAIMKSLSSPAYLAEAGGNKGFILRHSVGSLPHKVEVDVPLNYADYYFLEALYRRKNLN